MAFTDDRRYSFPVARITKGDDGDLYCEGLATDGSVDHDQQIVDPQWAVSAFKQFFDSGPNIRMGHDPTRPVGVGVDWRQEPAGGIWVKSCIVDPLAQKMLRRRVLRAYSVGISQAGVVRDSQAPGGRIVKGALAELSLVDRPSNARCWVQVVAKSADGVPRYVGKAYTVDEAAHWSVLKNCSCKACMDGRKACGCPQCSGVVKSVKKAAKLAADPARAAEKALRAQMRASLDSSDPRWRLMAEEVLRGQG